MLYDSVCGEEDFMFMFMVHVALFLGRQSNVGGLFVL